MGSFNMGNVDVEIIVDKSGSMTTCDAAGGKSRWKYAEESTLALATLADQVDQDGIAVVPFSNNYKVYEGVTAAKVAQVWQENSPMGGTDLAAPLKDRLAAHMARRAAGGTKNTCILVITDGEPNDRKAVKQVIIDATKQMQADEELAICFVQVGNDAGATSFLTELDDTLQSDGAKFDIVDTVKIDEVQDLASLVEKAFAD